MHVSYFNKAKPGNDHDIQAADFFIQEHILSAGFSYEWLANLQVNNFADYRNLFDEHIKNKEWGHQGVHYLFDNAKKGDFVWIQSHGVYYVTQLSDDPKNLFEFTTEQKYIDKDSVAHVKNVDWTEVGTEGAVPGSVSTAKSRLKGPMQRIDNWDGEPIKVGDEYYTVTSLIGQIAINKGNNENLYFGDLDRDKIFNLMGPTGLEDVLGVWLADKYGYITIPSTDKVSTQDYEYEMVDGRKKTDRRIYVQTKNGETPLDSTEYTNLLTPGTDNEVWLLTTRGMIDEQKDWHFVKLTSDSEPEIFQLQDLLDYIFDDANKGILPGSVSYWLDAFTWR